MSFDPHIAVTRFGAGLSPHHALPSDVASILAEAAAGDPLAARWPLMKLQDVIKADEDIRVLSGIAHKKRGTEEADAAKTARKAIFDAMRDAETYDIGGLVARMLAQPYGLGERLVQFWSSHFTVRGRGGALQYGVGTLASVAIRPHIMGRFEDMLLATVMHPIMLLYLDQAQSVGDNSRTAKLRPERGLNENYARELLELHTLGVDGPYTQDDVRELAEVLTGLTFQRGEGTIFREIYTEPGAETVLGKRYYGEELAPIKTVVRDLAAHPATGAHIARKLAVHFVSDTPDEALVAHVAARFVETQGDLAAVMAALLEHPAAWKIERDNVKWPLEYIASSLRVLGMTEAQMAAANVRQIDKIVRRPMVGMGHVWQRPNDPSGLEEEDESWITPQAVASRINWAMNMPRRFGIQLPEPAELLLRIAGPSAPPELAFAVNASESAREAVGLLLASPTFQRR